MMSYPREDNAQSNVWLERARFLLDTAGTEGVFIDGAGPVNALVVSCGVANGWDGCVSSRKCSYIKPKHT
jgi:hypothetical protein